MRGTPVLLRHHIGWHFYKHWVVQSKRKVQNTGAEKILRQKGVSVTPAEDILKKESTFKNFEAVDFNEQSNRPDISHPDWHERTLLTYKDNNVLLEGLVQAKIITKTIELKEGLPDSYVLNDIPKEVNRSVKNIIMYSHVFDSEQKKLPIVKDPLRPAWNFPRTYGITQSRRNKLLIAKLLQLLETTSDIQLVKQRYLFSDLLFSFPFERNGALIQFQLTGDTVLTSATPLSSISKGPVDGLPLPDIYPVDPMITLNKENIYKIKRTYPISSSIRKFHPHTIFLHYDKEEVRNIFEEAVTETQIYGRSLLKAFTVAATYAKQIYGDDVKVLPEPVTIQVIQTNSNFFHFGVFQLNTLDMEDGLERNIWYHRPLQYLFDNCGYNVGKPVLEGYNNEVVKQLYAFYNKV